MGRPVRMAGEEQGRRCQATHKGLVGWGVRISLFSVMGPWGGGGGEKRVGPGLHLGRSLLPQGRL